MGGGHAVRVASNLLCHVQLALVMKIHAYSDTQLVFVCIQSCVGVSLVLAMSELLNKSSLDLISIWLFDKTIFCNVYVLYYGCISPLSFSEIRRKITSNHLLQLENCRMQSFYHVGVTSACYIYQKIVIWMIPHTNFWWFRLQILKFFMILYTYFGEWSYKFSIRFNRDFIGLKQTILIWACWKRWQPYMTCYMTCISYGPV